MKTSELQLLQKLDSKSIMIYENNKKSKITAFLLALFLGGMGIQWFYLGKAWAGVLSILFCWAIVPSLISLISLFFVCGMVGRHNATILQMLQPEISEQSKPLTV